MKNMMKLTTADELLHMGGDSIRRELIRGEVKEMPPPGTRHGVVTGRLHAFLGHFVLTAGGGDVVSETGFLLEKNPDTVRAGDCAFIRSGRLPRDLPRGYLPIAPELVVETHYSDDHPAYVAEKVAAWLRFGVRLVWVVDPSRRTVTVHRRDAAPRLLEESGVLDGEEVLPGFRLPLAELWR